MKARNKIVHGPLAACFLFRSLGARKDKGGTTAEVVAKTEGPAAFVLQTGRREFVPDREHRPNSVVCGVRIGPGGYHCTPERVREV